MVNLITKFDSQFIIVKKKLSVFMYVCAGLLLTK